MATGHRWTRGPRPRYPAGRPTHLPSVGGPPAPAALFFHDRVAPLTPGVPDVRGLGLALEGVVPRSLLLAEVLAHEAGERLAVIVAVDLGFAGYGVLRPWAGVPSPPTCGGTPCPDNVVYWWD